MGQKVNPIAFRTGIMMGWRSRWYAPKKEFADLLVEDYKIRQYIKTWRPQEDRGGDDKGRGLRRGRDDKPIYSAIANIEIERTRDEVKVILHTARPGVLIGRKGERVEELQNELQMLTGRRISIDVREIVKPEIVAQLVAEDIAEQLSKRASFRRAMKRAMDMAMQAGAKGIKVQLSGRLGGAEMSRREKAILGSLPLSTLRAKIDYGFAIAKIPQGVIGVQVWINQGMYEEPSDGADAQTGQASKKPKRTYKR